MFITVCSFNHVVQRTKVNLLGSLVAIKKMIRMLSVLLFWWGVLIMVQKLTTDFFPGHHLS